MVERLAAPLGAAGLAALLLASGCSNGGSSTGSSDTSIDASSADASSADASSSTPSCAVDCSTIAAPPCQAARCNPSSGACELAPLPDGSGCDDGLFCTVDETCTAGACKGKANDCGVVPPTCQSVACDEASRSCGLTGLPDGVACASSDLCAPSGSCSQGACVGLPKSCVSQAAPDACHIAQCNPKTGACDVFVPGNDGSSCQGADPCTVGATCLTGTCQGGTPRSCNAWADDCNTAACDAAHNGCYSVPANANAACGVGDPCNTGMCDASGHCSMAAANDGASCANGISCTMNDACSSGVCVGTGGPQVFFSDTFASNARGWTMDHPWQIGSEEWAGACKPGTDHTGFGDNGVAATPLAGDDGDVAHPFAYLTSPAIDTSAASSLVLEFWYLIQWELPPVDDAVVEVWNGTAWVQVWQNNQFTTNCIDSNYNTLWQDARIDISAHKSSAMKVRFGTAAYIVSPNPGWTVDDVSVMSASCP